MGFLDGFRRDLREAKRRKAAEINGRHIKRIMSLLAKERDEAEERTGRRPPVDPTTREFMQKVLDAWGAEGRTINEQVFWREVDHNRQFTHPVEYYER